MKSNLMTQIPAVEPDELAFLQAFTRDVPEDKLQLFITVYNGKRKKTDQILLGCVLGFVLIAGIQRFMVKQTGMGLLYLFTGGLCLTGTIMDTVNHKRITFEFNRDMARESMAMVHSYR